ncbi:uncharacterized protein LOC133372347 [Rhineura floridana]|uniref:uncharacterized protein LOC133372347 n=1 Tax=Rhineura floridana TaxID=261503 RepID=UPI002AC81F2B|nr:uncharacterized protein LOC133372347 [Rhineura floridana]
MKMSKQQKRRFPIFFSGLLLIRYCEPSHTQRSCNHLGSEIRRLQATRGRNKEGAPGKAWSSPGLFTAGPPPLHPSTPPPPPERESPAGFNHRGSHGPTLSTDQAALRARKGSQPTHARGNRLRCSPQPAAGSRPAITQQRRGRSGKRLAPFSFEGALSHAGKIHGKNAREKRKAVTARSPCPCRTPWRCAPRAPSLQKSSRLTSRSAGLAATTAAACGSYRTATPRTSWLAVLSVLAKDAENNAALPWDSPSSAIAALQFSPAGPARGSRLRDGVCVMQGGRGLAGLAGRCVGGVRQAGGKRGPSLLLREKRHAGHGERVAEEGRRESAHAAPTGLLSGRRGSIRESSHPQTAPHAHTLCNMLAPLRLACF